MDIETSPRAKALALLAKVWDAVAEGDMRKEHKEEHDELKAFIEGYIPDITIEHETI